MRLSKPVARMLDKLMRGEVLDDEEREAVEVWRRRSERNLGRKTGAMPKGPLKRFRDDLSVAVEFALLRLKGVAQADAERAVANSYHIGTRTLWRRKKAAERFWPEMQDALRECLDFEARKRGPPHSVPTLKER